MGKVICYGEPMEERCYDGTSTISGDIFSIALGVQRLYPVIASALCGSLRKVEVHLLTALGCDARGDAVLRACEKNGIETGLIARKADKKTAAYEIPTARRGPRGKIPARLS